MIKNQKTSPGIENKPEISIIVPVYNMSKYLEQSLDSIKRQTYDNWECILVDDGSKDSSGNICDRYASEDERFKVIHQSNGGLSAARNTGLKHIKGKYVAFVDSDDWLDENYLKTLHGHITRYNVDVAQCGFVKEFRSFRRVKTLTPEPVIIEKSELVSELLQDSKIPSFVWNKLYKREVVTGNFPDGKVYEDFFMLSLWSVNIKKIFLDPSPLYHYRMRKSGITQNNNLKHQLDFIDAIKHRAEVLSPFVEKNGSTDDIKLFLYRKYLERAKLISRITQESQTMKQSLALIANELRALGLPEKGELGKKLLKRAKMLLERPNAFIKKMRIGGWLDFHSRYCRTQTYD